MNDTGRNLIRAAVGGYLAYIGGKLVRDTFVARTNNNIIFIIFGILFVGLGIGYAIWGFINVVKSIKEGPATDREGDSSETDDEEEQKTADMVETKKIDEEKE